jgi:hypothetical protein
MSTKAASRRARVRQKRSSPDDRRGEFIAKATEFFRARKGEDHRESCLA